MDVAVKPGKRNAKLGYFGTGHTIPVSLELLDSAAWAALTPLERDVLLGWLRVYMKLSGFDTRHIECGIRYTWSMHKGRISERTFYTAMKKIVQIGFFDLAEKLRISRAGESKVFIPSRRWTEYQPTAKQMSHEGSKEARINAKRARRAKRLNTGKWEKKELEKSAPITPAKNAPIRDEQTSKKCADTNAQNGNSHRQKMRRLDSYHAVKQPKMTPPQKFAQTGATMPGPVERCLGLVKPESREQIRNTVQNLLGQAAVLPGGRDAIDKFLNEVESRRDPIVAKSKGYSDEPIEKEIAWMFSKVKEFIRSNSTVHA